MDLLFLWHHHQSRLPPGTNCSPITFSMKNFIGRAPKWLERHQNLQLTHRRKCQRYLRLMNSPPQGSKTWSLTSNTSLSCQRSQGSLRWCEFCRLCARKLSGSLRLYTTEAERDCCPKETAEINQGEYKFWFAIRLETWLDPKQEYTWKRT